MRGSLRQSYNFGGSMGEVEVSINNEGNLKVSQRYDLGAFLLRPQGFGRRSVVDESKCSGDTEETEFIWRLKLLFLATLILTAVNFIIFESILTHSGTVPSWNSMFNYTLWLFGDFLIGPTGILLLVMFAVLLTVGVLTKNVTRGGILAWLRRRQAPTMSATIQHI